MPTKGDHNENKNHDVKRPRPRRLFSFDSVKSTASSSSRRSASSSDLDTPRGPRPMNTFDLSNVQEGTGEDEREVNMSVLDPFATQTTSPKEQWITVEPKLPSSPPFSPPYNQNRSSSRLEPVRPISIEPLRSNTSNLSNATAPPPRLWESLRQHVLTPPIRPSTPPQRPGSALSHASNQVPGRSATPKPSRLARLGFKQVVEGARGIQDDTRRFGEEILRACSIARYGDGQRSSKERDGSTSSLTSSAQATGMAPGGRKLDYLRRPMSIASLATVPQTASPPSLRSLYQILVYHSGAPSDGSGGEQLSAHLPHESRVLSTLLCPFLMPSRYPSNRVDEEQITAVEAFELVSKSWTALDEGAVIERCLWGTKSAASLLPHPTRTRILASLWRLLVRNDQRRMLLSVNAFQSMSSGLLLLLVSLYRSSKSSNSTFQGQATYGIPDHLLTANFQQPPHPDIHLLQDLVQQFLSGSLGELEDDSVEEDYGPEYASADRKQPSVLRHAVFTDALVNTLESSPGTREWLLCNAIEEYWPVRRDDAFTNLQAAICDRRLNTTCRVSLTLLRPYVSQPSTDLQVRSTPRTPSSASSSSLNSLDLPPTNVRVVSQLAAVFQSRIIPEAEWLEVETDIDDKVILETRVHVARVLLTFIRLNVDDPESRFTSPREDVFGGGGGDFFKSSGSGLLEHVKWAMDTIAGWYRAGAAMPWRGVLEKTFQQIITSGWQESVPILSALLRWTPDDIKKSAFAFILPLLSDQLVEDPPPYPSAEISSFLTAISRALPPLFYKPLFACAASDKEVIVVNHLCTIQVHAKYVKDYWTRDAEMLCVALLSDIGLTETSTSKDGKWGLARLGQSVLVVELIGRVQVLRLEKEAGNGSDAKFVEIMRFINVLETRIWQTIQIKEKKLLCSSSQRMLFCLLFREFRLFTRSLRPAPWLATTLEWFDVFCADDHIGALEQEVTDSVQRVQGLYMAAQEGVQQMNKRHTSTLAASVLKAAAIEPSDTNKPLDLAATFVEHRKLIDSLSKGYISRAMKLFVALSTVVSVEDYQRLGRILWQHCLSDTGDMSSTASACFLLMQCAERTPTELLPALEIDLHASDELTRLEAVRKVGILVNWRFQITTQNFLTDRTHRPFKLGRPPLPFIATDIGTSLYLQVEETNQNKDKDEVPLELKRRLAELGWVEEDAGVVDPRLELIKTPMSILPPSQMDRMEVGTGDVFATPASPLPSPQPSPHRPKLNRADQTQNLQPVDEVTALLRRNSSSGGPSSGVKRRPIFVPSLSLIFQHLATLVFDPNFSIAAASRTTLMDLMRNDPALLTRSILDQLAGENKDMTLAMSTFTAFLHVRRTLPPSLTHYVFNNLAGFLKVAAKHIDMPDALADFGQVIPTMTSLAIQVSGMSMREIRRSKMEHIFIPSGSLWFTSSAPKGPMFPRNLAEANDPFEPVPPQLVSITMIRVSQNLFFLAMLKRNYKDVQAVRKNMSRLALPSLEDSGYSKNLELRDFVPHRALPDARPSLTNGTVDILSLMVARSYILLVAQIFRSMPRHLSDRHELAILVDGLNRCLLAHGDDINIVSQVLIALMVASTRFRRLFMTGSGYTLFMPALAKVYIEKATHPGIRPAIEYAINRFYALHKESFLYQSINILGQIAMLPEGEPEWFSKGAFEMFGSLNKGAPNPGTDMGGIHNVNKAEEREALILLTADEAPQTFLSSIRRGESQSGYQMALPLPDDFESSRLSMDDFVRLFLTVIAHDLTISRAQHFLRLLRLLAPHLYNASASSRTVLADGIVALGLIFTRAFSKPKGGGELPKPPPEEEDDTFLTAGPGLENLSKEKTRIPSDSKNMRLDFLRLVLAFGVAGGQVSLTVARQAMDVTKSLLKDWAEPSYGILAKFLGDFVKMLLHREEPPVTKAVVAFLQELSPILHAFMTVNFTGVFETIVKLCEVPLYSHDPAFSQVIVSEICTAGLAACDLAGSENQLSTLPYRSMLISLLAEAVFLHGVDIIGELEKRPPTHNFLAGVILPLTLALKTEAQIVSDSTRTDEHRRALVNAWIRLLFYVMTACQKSRRDGDDVRNIFKDLTGSFRSKSNDNRKQEGAFWRSHLPTFMISLQVIKVIVVRGAEDISSLPRLGVWERLAAFFRTMLAEGNADFALRSDPNSVVTTPTQSPRSSSQFDHSASKSGYNLFVSTSSDLNQPGSPLFLNESKAFSRPRLIDYSLWSMLEFVCAYRSPLRMQLKLLTLEKVLALNVELDQQSTKRPGSSSGYSPYPSSPSSRRVSASIGSKARQRASAQGLPSLESSPYLLPSPSNLSVSPFHLSASTSSLAPSPSHSTLSPPHLSSSQSSPMMLEIPVNSRRPGYAISPVTPRDHPPGRPNIVHLGPSSPSAFPSVPSPMIGAGLKRVSRTSSVGVESMAESQSSGTKARATKVKSVHLIRETYRRIRGVQTFMGYTDLLPMPGSRLSMMRGESEDTNDPALETWTRSKALATIVKETNDLLEEFEETFAPGDDPIMVEVVEPMTPLGIAS